MNQTRRRFDGIVIARSHRASTDARLSTGYREEAIQGSQGAGLLPWIAAPSLTLGLVMTDQPKRQLF